MTEPEGWHRGDWLQTYTGRQFYPRSPEAIDVDPEDVAHSLSLQCRFGGHVDRFYSVAEHCVLMSRWVLNETGDRNLALWALLHDATEAYVVDVPRPVKRMLRDYAPLERRVMGAVAERFGLGHVVGMGVDVMPPIVQEADGRILLTERNTLMSRHGHWHLDGMIEPLPVKVTGWSPDLAEHHYLEQLERLAP